MEPRRARRPTPTSSIEHGHPATVLPIDQVRPATAHRIEGNAAKGVVSRARDRDDQAGAIARRDPASVPLERWAPARVRHQRGQPVRQFRPTRRHAGCHQRGERQTVNRAAHSDGAVHLRLRRLLGAPDPGREDPQKDTSTLRTATMGRPGLFPPDWSIDFDGIEGGQPQRRNRLRG